MARENFVRRKGRSEGKRRASGEEEKREEERRTSWQRAAKRLSCSSSGISPAICSASSPSGSCPCSHTSAMHLFQLQRIADCGGCKGWWHRCLRESVASDTLPGHH
eukprot:1749426-Rhodomonas_salina.2